MITTHRAAALALALLTIAGAAGAQTRPRSQRRIPVTKDTTHEQTKTIVHDTVGIPMFTPPVHDTVASPPVHDSITVQTIDSISRTRWFPVPIPIPFRHTRTVQFAGRVDSFTVVRQLPPVQLPGRVDTLFQPLILVKLDTVPIVRWRTDTLTSVGKADTIVVHGDTLVVYCPPPPRCACERDYPPHDRPPHEWPHGPPHYKPPTVTATPEPATLALVVPGLAVVAIVARRRRRSLSLARGS